MDFFFPVVRGPFLDLEPAIAFIVLDYINRKAKWYGKTLLRIGQFEPSLKVCNACGFHNSGLTLKDKEWTYPDCKTKHDRDINAAINIKKFSSN